MQTKKPLTAADIRKNAHHLFRHSIINTNRQLRKKA